MAGASIMKQTTATTWSVIILTSIMTFTPGTSTASMDADGAGAPPRPENYASYSLYIQALFNHQKMQSKDKGATIEKSCRKKNANDPNEPGKTNACQPPSAAEAGAGAPGDTQYESLEDAISKRSADLRPDHINTSTHQRSTFRSFPLSPIPAQDLSQTGVSGLLGFFNSRIFQDQTSARADQQLNSNNSPSINNDPRVSNEIASLLYAQIIGETITMGGNVVLRDGNGHVEVTGKVVGTGLQLQLSSNVRTGLYIVDRDGYPGSRFDQAGAVVVNSLGISIPNMLINIQGINRTSSNPELIGIQVNSPSAITVDLSGTTIGAADAVRDGSKIGAATNFLSIGPHSALTISPGMSLNATLSRPDGMVTPLVTINGNLGDINLQNISLLDNGMSAFQIGNLGINGIALVDTRIYIDGQRIVIDAGTGINNASVSMEQLSFGDAINTTMLGDLYVSHINLVNARMSVEAH